MAMKEIRTLAMYLPQFHRIPENDRWWGEGYTEWSAVKTAEPLFAGHRQPKVPLDKNYYNLLEKDVMAWQSSLMKKYGIDGQCFYHYYFRDGKMVLEKPAENLLAWKDIDMQFCFCWANGSWARTWSRIAGNSWADKFEGRKGGEELLLEQTYGREKEWKAHFEYLLPFFRDERYIKADGRPVFLFYAPKYIGCLCQMLDCWEELAAHCGIGKLYTIGMNMDTGILGLDAVLLHAPHQFWSLDAAENGVYRPDYQQTWENILKRPGVDGYRTYFEGVANCDDTPRRGSNGVAFRRFSVDTFRDGMYELYKKSIRLGNRFVFLNAWNEWGEGMYLEPDEENGCACLEAVYDAKQAALKECDVISETPVGRKYQLIITCLDKWLELREGEGKIQDLLHRNDVRTAAVYGIGVLGRHLVNELAEGNIDVRYVIDQKVRMYRDYVVKKPEEELPEVDAIIVTVPDEFDKIYDKLKKKVRYKIFSILELVEEG